ncbi:hypothetical protein [uncultured Psychrobacter sp.]|uniref:hypothetical protein n=1 Tax=uncultured Psychrobacter sp. TaxID=259303 RepID=UPI00345849B8
MAYAAAKWRYSSVVDQVNATCEALRERLNLKTEQTESYKERALKYDEKALEVVDSTEIALKEKSLTFVKDLRDFTERYKREDEALHRNEWKEMGQISSGEEKSDLRRNFVNESLRLSNS